MKRRQGDRPSKSNRTRRQQASAIAMQVSLDNESSSGSGQLGIVRAVVDNMDVAGEFNQIRTNCKINLFYQKSKRVM